MFRKKTPSAGARSRLDERVFDTDQTHSRIHQPDTWIAHPHPLALTSPDAEYMREVMTREIRAAFERGAFDGGSYAYQDAWVTNHVAGWMAARYAEHTHATRTSEVLRAQAVANHRSEIEKVVRLQVEHDRLVAVVAESHLTLTGKQLEPAETDSARTAVLALLGESGLSDLPRAGATQERPTLLEATVHLLRPANAREETETELEQHS